MDSSERPSVARGDVWLVDLDPVVGSEQAKTRPCVVMQRDAANRVARTTIVIPVTDAAKHHPSIVQPLLAAGIGGLSKESIGLCAQVRVVDRMRMVKRLGHLPSDVIDSLGRGLVEILDLGSLV